MQQIIHGKKKSEGKEKPAEREEGDAVTIDADHSEEKVLKEKENVEQKTKQKVHVLVNKSVAADFFFLFLSKYRQ